MTDIANQATDILAAIEAASTPATMVRLVCGDHVVLRGVHLIGDEVPCPDCKVPSMIVDAFETAIVKGI